MKKIIILLTSIIIVIVSFSCSEDHSAPTFDKYVKPTPSNVAAVYNSEAETVGVTWTMNDKTDVVGYQLSVSDSSLFDLGHVYTKAAGSETNYTMDVKDESGTLYIKVAAIFDSETMKNYYGQRSDDTASVLIERDSE